MQMKLKVWQLPLVPFYVVGVAVYKTYNFLNIEVKEIKGGKF